MFAGECAATSFTGKIEIESGHRWPELRSKDRLGNLCVRIEQRIEVMFYKEDSFVHNWFCKKKMGVVYVVVLCDYFRGL